MEKQLTEGRPFGVLLRYALPVLGGNLFQLFYTLADTVIVGKTLGADALAARRLHRHHQLFRPMLRAGTYRAASVSAWASAAARG